MEDKIYNIGVLLGNTFTDYPKELEDGIYAASRNQPVNVLFFLGTQGGFFYKNTLVEENASDYDYQYNTIYDFALLSHADAFIISYGALGRSLKGNRVEFLNRFGKIPYVILEDEAERGKGTSIIADNYGGMRTNVEHLINVHGYRKILFLSGMRENRDANERKQAYLDVMHESGLPVTESWIAYGDFTRYAKQQVQTLLEAHPDAEALVCANDEMAFAAYQVCEEKGLKVGRDIAITGFDNAELSCIMNPPLTTVSQNGYEIGYRAVDLAIQLCRGNIPEPQRMETKLVRRFSCGCRNYSSIRAGSYKIKNGVNYDMSRKVQSLTEFQRKSWFGPLLTRNLMEVAENSAKFYSSVIRHLKGMGMKSAYLYTLESPMEHHPKDPWKCPDIMRLACFFDENRLQSFEPQDGPLIHRGSGFTHLYKPEGGRSYIAFTLFSGKRIFGLLFCEIDLDEIPYMYLVSLHLGNTIRFMEVSLEEQSAKRQLQQKNEVLSFISEKDELTNLYNRRGLVERVMALNQENAGSSACLIFADMDHLKEINDLFGHSEGDCVIRTAAALLQHVLKNVIWGRIGGDEFVGVALTNSGMDGENMRRQIAATFRKYNECSDKPYFLEFSVGIENFSCSQSMDFSKILKNADTSLYTAKKVRRLSAIR